MDQSEKNSSPLTFDVYLAPRDSAEKIRIEKRKSNLLKLNEENEKLRWELKALSDKLEAAERQRAQHQQPLETRIE